MKSNLIASLVVAASAFATVGASAQTFNTYLFDQMKAPVTKTRAEVRAEAAQGQASSSAYNGATAQQNLNAPQAEKAGAAPQAAADVAKTAQQ